MKSKMTFIVRASVPDDATMEEILAFFQDLEWVGGCRHPYEDPLFDSFDKVKAERATPARVRALLAKLEAK